MIKTKKNIKRKLVSLLISQLTTSEKYEIPNGLLSLTQTFEHNFNLFKLEITSIKQILELKYLII